jgi:uncharacterized membrane protein YraQ (UPF0718 family)
MLERYLIELWRILLELSPSLLLGLFIAGLIHVFLPAGLIHRGLNRPNMTSVRGRRCSEYRCRCAPAV